MSHQAQLIPFHDHWQRWSMIYTNRTDRSVTDRPTSNQTNKHPFFAKQKHNFENKNKKYCFKGADGNHGFENFAKKHKQ